jgi:hypothetical protein
MANPIIPLDPAQQGQVWQYAAREGYPYRCLVALDMFANTLTGGYLCETISSRSARADRAGKWWGTAMSWFLDLFEYDHGAKAMAADAERATFIQSIEHQ